MGDTLWHYMLKILNLYYSMYMNVAKRNTENDSDKK